MFQGITDQITEAQKEIQKQEVLQAYKLQLEKALKTENRKLKKTETAISKSNLNLEPDSIQNFPGLKSFFFAVFEKQEKEKEKRRTQFIENSMYRQAIPLIIEHFKNEQQKITAHLKANKEIKSLERIIKKIRTATLDKYYFQEVSTMFQFVDRSARIDARDEEFDKIIEMGEKTLSTLRAISRDLKNEKSWGSWEDFYSKNNQPGKTPSSEIDSAFEKAPIADAMIRALAMKASPFIEGRDMTLHFGNLEGYLDAFIVNMNYDWKYNARTKTLRSKTNQIFNSVDMILHGIKALKEQNKNEKSLMAVEKDKRIKKTEDYVKQKLSEKF
ncbi:MAG: hypothetical protein ACOCTO_00545 [Marinilabiliaceae bacterium]